MNAVMSKQYTNGDRLRDKKYQFEFSLPKL